MGFKDDSEGQIFSMDLLIALIPITIVLGMVAADMDNILYLVQDTVYRGTTERAAFDTANALLETSGTPSTWEVTNASNRIAGLAIYDTNTGKPKRDWISPDKLASLKETDVQNLLGNNYGFYLEVTSSDGNKIWKNVSTNGNGYNSSASDIVKVEKGVRFAKLNVVSSIEGQIRGVSAPRDYSNPPDQFPTSYLYNQTYDYYIVTNNSGFSSANVTFNGIYTVILSNLTQYYKINSTYLNMNQTNPTQFFNNTVKVSVNGTSSATMNLYIVQVLKNIDTSELTPSNVVPQPCKFRLYVWAK